MPLIRTKNDDSAVKLNVTVKYGHYGTTTIKINGVEKETIGGNFVDHPIGTNRELKNKDVSVTTSVMIHGGNSQTEVDFDIRGAIDDDHNTSSADAGGQPSITHFIDYSFI
jgi:hypothetical protein